MLAFWVNVLTSLKVMAFGVEYGSAGCQGLFPIESQFVFDQRVYFCVR